MYSTFNGCLDVTESFNFDVNTNLLAHQPSLPLEDRLRCLKVRPLLPGDFFLSSVSPHRVSWPSMPTEDMTGWEQPVGRSAAPGRRPPGDGSHPDCEAPRQQHSAYRSPLAGTGTGATTQQWHSFMFFPEPGISQNQCFRKSANPISS